MSQIETILLDGENVIMPDLRDYLAELEMSKRYSVLNDIPTALHADIIDDTNTTALHTYIQAAIVAAKAAGNALYFPPGTYLIGAALTNITNDLLVNLPENGIKLVSDGSAKTIFKASATFPAATAMLNLDGNSLNNTSPSTAVAQNGNYVCGFTFQGSGVAVRGLRLRANAHFYYGDLVFKNFAGSVSDAAILISGVTGAGLDDADTTYDGLFDRVRINGSTGYGVLGIDHRCGIIKFDNCYIENCAYDGMRISFAGLTLDNVCFAFNGQFGANSGGFAAVMAATGSRNRGLSMTGCLIESNYWYDLNLAYIYGADISGFVSNPYQGRVAVYAQAFFDIGAVAAEGVSIHGGRVQQYTTNGWFSKTFKLRAGAANVSIDNISIGDAVYPWTATTVYALTNERTPTVPTGFTYECTVAGTSAGTEPVWPVVLGDTVVDGTVQWTTRDSNYYMIDPSASGITKDGHSISHTSLTPSFMVWGTTNAAVAATLVNGVEFTTSAYIQAAGVTVDHNNGARLNTTTSAVGLIFTAPSSGFYEFNVNFTAYGLNSTHRRLLTQLIRVTVGTIERYVLADVPLISSPATDAWRVGGPIQIKLLKGDKVSGSITLSGGTGNASIDRTLPGAFTFSGRAF